MYYFITAGNGRKSHRLPGPVVTIRGYRLLCAVNQHCPHPLRPPLPCVACGRRAGTQGENTRPRGSKTCEDNARARPVVSPVHTRPGRNGITDSRIRIAVAFFFPVFFFFFKIRKIANYRNTKLPSPGVAPAEFVGYPPESSRFPAHYRF